MTASPSRGTTRECSHPIKKAQSVTTEKTRKRHIPLVKRTLSKGAFQKRISRKKYPSSRPDHIFLPACRRDVSRERRRKRKGEGDKTTHPTIQRSTQRPSQRNPAPRQAPQTRIRAQDAIYPISRSFRGGGGVSLSTLFQRRRACKCERKQDLVCVECEGGGGYGHVRYSVIFWTRKSAIPIPTLAHPRNATHMHTMRKCALKPPVGKQIASQYIASALRGEEVCTVCRFRLGGGMEYKM